MDEIVQGVARQDEYPQGCRIPPPDGEACHNRLISMVMEALVKVFERSLAKVPRTLEMPNTTRSLQEDYETLVQRKKARLRA